MTKTSLPGSAIAVFRNQGRPRQSRMSNTLLPMALLTAMSPNPEKNKIKKYLRDRLYYPYQALHQRQMDSIIATNHSSCGSKGRATAKTIYWVFRKNFDWHQTFIHNKESFKIHPGKKCFSSSTHLFITTIKYTFVSRPIGCNARFAKLLTSCVWH